MTILKRGDPRSAATAHLFLKCCPRSSHSHFLRVPSTASRWCRITTPLVRQNPYRVNLFGEFSNFSNSEFLSIQDCSKMLRKHQNTLCIINFGAFRKIFTKLKNLTIMRFSESRSGTVFYISFHLHITSIQSEVPKRVVVDPKTV